MNQTDTILHVSAPTVENPVVDTSTVAVPKAVAPKAAPKAAPKVAAPATAAPATPAATVSPVAVTDSVATDSVTVKKTQEWGILLTPPETVKTSPVRDDNFGMSLILGGLAILFFMIGLRCRNNRKYLGVMARSLVDVRTRGNAFDETVTETFFLVLLMLMWSCSAGIILWGFLGFETTRLIAASPWNSFGLPSLVSNPPATIAICMGVGVAYTCLMTLAYITVGSVFTDGRRARQWLKGFSASLGLLSFIYFPVALLLLFNPQWTEILLIIALVTFILAKIIFIWKGFRIFFTQISSWVLFLYYLCSLEIVPLILTGLGAMWLCSLVG